MQFTRTVNIMGFKEKMAVKQEATLEKNEGKALDNFTKRRDWIITKLGTQLGFKSLNDEISKLSQELFYLDAAIKSLQEQPASA
jgi:glucose-6-phosphate 1-dehydrogenase